MSECISGTPLSEELLFSALDGDAEQSVIDHLNACAFCQERLDNIATVEKLIKLVKHPPAQELLDYDEGFMDSGPAASIERHLQKCAHCRKLLEILRANSDEAPWITNINARPGEPSKVVASIHSLSADRPRVAGKGRNAPLVRQFNAEDLEIDLTIAQSERTLTVSGLVSAANPQEQTSWQNAVLTLRQEGTIRATALLNQRGRFTCSALLSELERDPSVQILKLEIVVRSSNPARTVSIPIEVPN